MVGLNSAQMIAAWEEFVGGNREPGFVDPRILRSWKRCLTYLSPTHKNLPKHLSEDHLLATQVASFELISVARPIMEDIFENIEHSGVAVVLVNSAGYILDILSDPHGSEIAHSLGLSMGVSLIENQFGTNAFGLALVEHLPARVVGAEHFLKELHSIADVAAPVFDWNGAPLGALGIIAPLSNFHPNNYALAVLGARATKGQRQSDLLLSQQMMHLAGLKAFIATLSDAVLILDAKAHIIFANPAAERLFQLTAPEMQRKGLLELAGWPGEVVQAVERKEQLSKARIVLSIGQSPVACNLTIQFAQNSQEIQWTVLTLQRRNEEPRLQPVVQTEKWQTRWKELTVEAAGMRRIWRLARQAASAKAGVLVRGEPGVGKSLLVRAMYLESPQSKGPFILFPCSTLPAQLALEELLGFEQGANANRPDGRPSKFELAESGVLYFQDIEHLPLQAQSALVDYLNYNLIQRLGSDHPVPVDARIMASTTANLERLVNENRFRPELYYRLSAFKIVVPPLRERKKDLPIIAERILERISTERNRSYQFGPGVLELLQAYSWPGNLRELEAVLGGAAARASVTGVIGLAHFPETLRAPQALPPATHAVPGLRPMKEVEEQTLIQAARLYKGNVTKMAESLQIGRTTVWRKLKEFNVSLDVYRESNSDNQAGGFSDYEP